MKYNLDKQDLDKKKIEDAENKILYVSGLVTSTVFNLKKFIMLTN